MEFPQGIVAVVFGTVIVECKRRLVSSDGEVSSRGGGGHIYKGIWLVSIKRFESTRIGSCCFSLALIISSSRVNWDLKLYMELCNYNRISKWLLFGHCFHRKMFWDWNFSDSDKNNKLFYEEKCHFSWRAWVMESEPWKVT